MNKLFKQAYSFWFPVHPAEWTRIHSYLSFAIFSTFVVFGLSIPENILTSQPWLREVTNLFSSIFPIIDNVSHKNPREEVNRVFFSSMFSISPLILPLAIKHELYFILVKDKMKKDADWSLHFLRILIVSVIALYALFMFEYRTFGRLNHRYLSTPIGTSIIAPLTVYLIMWPFTYGAALFIFSKRRLRKNR